MTKRTGATTDGFDEDDLWNVADVHEEVGTPVLEERAPNRVENDEATKINATSIERMLYLFC